MKSTEPSGTGIFRMANLLKSDCENDTIDGYNTSDFRARKYPRYDGSILRECIRMRALAIVEYSDILSKLDVEDAINLVIILFQTGHLNLYSDPEDFQDHFLFSSDESTKKVNQLVLQNSPESDSPLQFPAESISSLDALKDLKLSNVNVISSNMTPDKSMTSIPHMKQRMLCNLTNLDISFWKLEHEGAVLETKIFHLLPKLESITFRIFTGKTEKLYFRNVLSDIGNRFCMCQKTLRSIDMSYSKCTEDELKTLLVDVVPKLPNLVHINMSYNKIESIQRVAECISANRSVTNNSLQILDLSWNAAIGKMHGHKEKASLLMILRAFKGLYNLGNDIDAMAYSLDVKYQLQINHSGRRLTEDFSLVHKTIPKGLIPFVLERAFQKSLDIYPTYWRQERKKDPTGVYYLLQNWSISDFI